MKNEKLIKLLTDYVNSFNNNLLKIKDIPSIEKDVETIFNVTDDTIEFLFKGDKEKIELFKFTRFLLEENLKEDLEFEITDEQQNLIREFISLAKSYVEDNRYEIEMLEEAKKLLKILTSDFMTLDTYTDIDMEVINHIMAYQKLTPEEVNALLKEILLTINSFQEEFLDLEIEENVEDYEAQVILNKEEENIIRNYGKSIAGLTQLKEVENIALYNELNNNQNIMERATIRQKLVEGNLKLALSIFIDNFLIYYPKINLEDILGELNIVVVEALNKYNPNEKTVEVLLKQEIKVFVKDVAKRIETPFSMSESEQQLGTIIMSKEETNLDSFYARNIYNAINPEQIEEDSLLEATDTELSVLDNLELQYFLSKLDPIDATIMTLRLGIDGISMSQQEVSEYLKKMNIANINQPQVSNREREARKRLKEYLKQTRSFRK